MERIQRKGQNNTGSIEKSSDVVDTDRTRLSGRGKTGENRENERKLKKGDRFALHGKEESTRNHWAVEPAVGRVAYGVPNRVDRLKCLGNAVVPQVAQVIGEMIKEFELERR